MDNDLDSRKVDQDIPPQVFVMLSAVEASLTPLQLRPRYDSAELHSAYLLLRLD